MWILAAVFSAIFAGVTSVLSKCGIKNTDSDVATALRTGVVLLFAWFIALITGAVSSIGEIDLQSWLFLVASGLATAASWLCYFKALSLGEVSRVAAVDKSSLVLTSLFALALFPDERGSWQIKLACVAVIGVGIFLTTDINLGVKGQKSGWLIFALGSAVFAALTSVLAKIGLQNVNSNLATAIRTCVVFAAAWGVAAANKKLPTVREIQKKDLAFLILSGIATGISWLCYYYAIQNGQVSVVAPIDKISVLIAVIFSATALKEKVSIKAWIGLFLITLGTVLTAIAA